LEERAAQAPPEAEDNEMRVFAEKVLAGSLTLVNPEGAFPEDHRSNGRQTFAVLFERFRSQAVRHARKFVHEDARAEDIVQAVFTSFWSHWETIRATYQAEEDLRRLTIVAVTNKARDYFRWRKANPEDSYDASSATGEEHSTLHPEQRQRRKSVPLRRQSPQERAILLKEEYEEWETLHLAALGEKDFRIYLLRGLGFDSVDIQKREGLPSDKAVRTRLTRIRKKLKGLGQSDHGLD
jgi:RNA polymerase sigma factor (sigma-70 family)